MAELAAVLIGDRLRIGCRLENHAACLKDWAQLLREHLWSLLQVLSDARRAAAPAYWADPLVIGRGAILRLGRWLESLTLAFTSSDALMARRAYGTGAGLSGQPHGQHRAGIPESSQGLELTSARRPPP